MSDLIIRQAMALKLKSDSSLSLDQAIVTKSMKQSQLRSYTSKRKGYCKALPKAPLTPKASESRWALMAKGTANSYSRNVCQLDAKHSSGAKPDPVTMAELSRKLKPDKIERGVCAADVVEWFIKNANTLNARNRRTLKHYIQVSNLDAAIMLIAQS